MKIDFSQEITNLDGTPNLPHETLCKLACFAIGSFLPGDEKIDGLEKVQLGHLGFEIFRAKEPIEISVEQVSALKARINRIFPAPVVAQAFDMIEGKSTVDLGRKE